MVVCVVRPVCMHVDRHWPIANALDIHLDRHHLSSRRTAVPTYRSRNSSSHTDSVASGFLSFSQWVRMWARNLSHNYRNYCKCHSNYSSAPRLWRHICTRLLVDANDSSNSNFVRRDDSWFLVCVLVSCVALLSRDVAVIPADSDSVHDYNCKWEYSHRSAAAPTAVMYCSLGPKQINSANFCNVDSIDWSVDWLIHVTHSGTHVPHSSPNASRNSFWFVTKYLCRRNSVHQLCSRKRHPNDQWH